MRPFPSLGEHLKNHDITPKKSLGQNFLLDESLLDSLVAGAGVKEGDIVLEIGPGPGGLTRALLKKGARVFAVEKDAQFLPLLSELEEETKNPSDSASSPSPFSGELTIWHQDALKIDFDTLPRPTKEDANAVRVVANLPYAISTPLLSILLKQTFFDSFDVMVQKEVGERLSSPPCCKTFGRLSILAQSRGRVRRTKTLPAGAFYPPPKVDSVMIQMHPHTHTPSSAVLETVDKLAFALFAQRRKKIRKALKSFFADVFVEEAHLIEAITPLGVSLDTRAEDITVAQFIALGQLYNDKLA